MWAEEVQVGGIGMRLRDFTEPWWYCRPIQGDACKMNQLDLLPLAKPVNPGFHPVMIRGYGEEERQECAEGHVAAVIPIELVERHGTDKADEENGQPPSRKCCAGSGSLSNEAIGTPDNPFEPG